MMKYICLTGGLCRDRRRRRRLREKSGRIKQSINQACHHQDHSTSPSSFSPPSPTVLSSTPLSTCLCHPNLPLPPMPYFSSVRSYSSQKSSAHPQQTSSNAGILPLTLPSAGAESSRLSPTVGSPDTPELSEKHAEGALSQPPATATALPSSSGSSRSSQGRKGKSTRFEQGLRVHWARFLRKVGGGEEDLTDSGEIIDAETPNSWDNRHAKQDDADEDDAEDEKSVNEVVVDRSWGRSRTATESLSDDEDGVDKSGDGPRSRSLGNGTSSSGDPDGPIHPTDGFWNFCLPLTIIRWRLWPAAVEFFSARFQSEKSENHYRKEFWFQSKVSERNILVLRHVYLREFSHLLYGRLYFLSLTGCWVAHWSQDLSVLPTLFITLGPV